MPNARGVTAALVALLAVTTIAAAEPPSQQDVDELKELLLRQEQSIRELKERVRELEGAAEVAPARPAPAQPPPVVREPGAPPAMEEAEARIRAEAAHTRQSPIRDRDNLDDRQEAVPRPGDF